MFAWGRVYTKGPLVLKGTVRMWWYGTLLDFNTRVEVCKSPSSSPRERKPVLETGLLKILGVRGVTFPDSHMHRKTNKVQSKSIKFNCMSPCCTEGAFVLASSPGKAGSLKVQKVFAVFGPLDFHNPCPVELKKHPKVFFLQQIHFLDHFQK